MALLPLGLTAGLLSTFRGVSTFLDAGQGWARAYYQYALSAQANGIPPVLLPPQESLLAVNLAAAFTAGVASPGATLGAMERAFQAFWMAPPVAFGVGTVTLAPPGLGALLGATAAANLVAETSAQAAGNVALALDAWTRLVVVTFPTTPPIVATLL